MKTNKSIAMGVLGLASVSLMGGAVSAYGGGMGGADRYEQMRSIYMSATSYEDFQAKMEVIKAERQAEREAFKNSVTKTVTKLSNGVEVTMTSDDAAVVEKLQNKPEREAREGSEVTKVKTNIANGVKVTVTTDNADLVERIQSKAERVKKGGRGHGGKHGRGGKRGGRGQAPSAE